MDPLEYALPRHTWFPVARVADFGKGVTSGDTLGAELVVWARPMAKPWPTVPRNPPNAPRSSAAHKNTTHGSARWLIRTAVARRRCPHRVSGPWSDSDQVGR